MAPLLLLRVCSSCLFSSNKFVPLLRESHPLRHREQSCVVNSDSFYFWTSLTPNMRNGNPIRGLRQVLDRVLDKPLGRHVIGDEEEAPQRRRQTTLTRRQRKAATIVEDVNHVNHAADEVRELHELVTNHVGADTKGFLGNFPKFTP
ncbi:hypothetical protein HKD37_06G015308 [Glycine soja]